MKIELITGTKDIDVVTVAIVENLTENWKLFNCPTCKNPVFQYRGQMVAIVPGYAPAEIPIVLQCSNKDCRQKYLIKTILSRTFDV